MSLSPFNKKTMDKLTIRKEIAALINSIKEHSDNIGNSHNIPQLELELILHKIEKLYQKSIVFNHLNSEERLQGDEPEKKTIKKDERDPGKEPEKKPVDLFGSVITDAEKVSVVKKEKKEEKIIQSAPPVQNIARPYISSLRSAIGINDKFQFANELFGGNMQEYEIAIQQLNSAETMDSAIEYFSSIQALYNWQIDNDTVKRLFDLVERRYSA